METRPTNAVPFVPHAPARVEAAPAREAVRTELAAPQAVTAQVGAERARWEKSRDSAPVEITPRRTSSVTTDRDTGDLVYQVLDPGTRAVLVQTPHESILKLRAYIHKVERQEKEHAAEIHQKEIHAEDFAAEFPDTLA